jgi:hypothetical protein
VVRLVSGMACACLSTVCRADTLRFECIWEQAIPTIIEVDTESMRVTRSDGGRPYQLIQLSERAVWLQVPDPDTATVAIIQRVPPAGGTFTLVDMTWYGKVSSRVAGVCTAK